MWIWVPWANHLTELLSWLRHVQGLAPRPCACLGRQLEEDRSGNIKNSGLLKSFRFLAIFKRGRNSAAFVLTLVDA
jgi:hypothetical protein